MIKLLGSLAILVGLAAPAQAQLYPYCILGGASVLNIRAAPEGPIVGHLSAGTAIEVHGTAPPWLYITSEYGEGWVWGNYVDPGCVPPQPCCVTYVPPCCGELPTAPPPEQNYNRPHPRHYHEKGEYQEPPPPHEEYHEAPPPPAHGEAPSCYSTDAGCGNKEDYKPNYNH